MDKFVLREDKGRVCTLTLNRPEALNALNMPLFVELRRHVEALSAQVHHVACIILKGAGKSFSAGHDLKDIQKRRAAAGAPFPGTNHTGAGRSAPACHRQCQWALLYGGLELALGSDTIIASRSAKFADTHCKWGLSPLWGMTQRLPRRVSQSRAKQMMFTSDVFTAAAAERMGLIDICVDDEELEQATLNLAERIAANSTYSNQVNKALLSVTDGMSIQAGLAYELAHSPEACTDAQDRVASFGKK